VIAPASPPAADLAVSRLSLKSFAVIAPLAAASLLAFCASVSLRRASTIWLIGWVERSVAFRITENSRSVAIELLQKFFEVPRTLFVERA
jgi:hypothetical protein